MSILLAVILGIGLYFTWQAGKNILLFFVPERSLSWYLNDASMIAASFVAAVPLWVTSLMRQHGVYYIW